MKGELIALLNDAVIGLLRIDRTGRFSFRYDDDWRGGASAIPLSLSMPLITAEHGHRVTEPYLWGLLPDNELVLERWAREFQVSARNPFALLQHVGEDCAGAVRFVTAERLASLPRESAGQVEWLTEQDIASRLRALGADASAWRKPSDQSYFSLAGAQAKTALYFDGTRYGVPLGRRATTHILKPDIGGLDGHAINEHLCLELARDLGLPVARSSVQCFEDQVAIVVERYDRRAEGKTVLRFHQEDFCQALAIHPTHKYEHDGGPGARQIVEVLRQSSRVHDEDVMSFVRALALNWVIGGTDAHGKNYSLLIGARGTVRLAPLYDVASVLPYHRGTSATRKLKLAMKIGGNYKLDEIGPREWSKLATEMRVDRSIVREVVIDTCTRLPFIVETATERARAAGLQHAIIDDLRTMLVERSERCLRSLSKGLW